MTSGAIHNLTTTLMLIGIFGIGSIIAMFLIGGLMGIIPISLTNNTKAKKIMRCLTDSFSFVLGITIVYQIGIIKNLFRF